MNSIIYNVIINNLNIAIFNEYINNNISSTFKKREITFQVFLNTYKINATFL